MQLDEPHSVIAIQMSPTTTPAPVRIMCAGCRRITADHPSGRCEPCRLGAQRRKDATPERRAQKAKYGVAHRRLRRQWAPLVATGTVRCWRCQQPITAGDAWHLGHRPDQPSAPEHADENMRHSNESKDMR